VISNGKAANKCALLFGCGLALPVQVMIKGGGRLFRKQKQVRSEEVLGINLFSWDCVEKWTFGKRNRCDKPRVLY
jgi:hypothetical protein